MYRIIPGIALNHLGAVTTVRKSKIYDGSIENKWFIILYTSVITAIISLQTRFRNKQQVMSTINRTIVMGSRLWATLRTSMWSTKLLWQVDARICDTYCAYMWYIYIYMCVCVCVFKKDRDRETDRDRQTERDREGERERKRKRDRDRQRHREREREGLWVVHVITLSTKHCVN